MSIAKAKRLVLNILLTFNFPALVFALNSFMAASTLNPKILFALTVQPLFCSGTDKLETFFLPVTRAYY